MSAATRFVRERGGCCSRTELMAASSRRQVEQAVGLGELVVLGRGRIVLPELDAATGVAHGLHAVLTSTSAALWHGWPVKTLPPRPVLAVGRGRRLTTQQQAQAVFHRLELHPDEIVDGVCTSVEMTLEQCLRHLPEDEGLAIADSALREGVTPATLQRVARSVRGPGSVKVRQVLARADGRAANPFESVLRHLAHQVPGLHVEPQRVLVSHRQTVRPDLVDDELRIVLEADSFAWEDVMHDPAYVIEALTAVTRMRSHSTRCPVCAA